MYGRQKYFEFRDKPGRMLVENSERNKIEEIRNKEDMLVFQPKQ